MSKSSSGKGITGGIALIAAIGIGVAAFSGGGDSSDDPAQTKATEPTAIVTTVAEETAPETEPTVITTEETTTVLTEPPEPVETQDPDLEERDFVLNTSTMKFHKPDCNDVPEIDPVNRKDIHTSRQAVLDLGYVPCKHCYP